MLSLPALARMTGYSGSALTHNMKLHPLSSGLPLTRQGKARGLTLENGIEIVSRFALHDCGLAPENAAETAAAWLSEYKSGRIDQLPYRPLNLSRRQRTARVGLDEPRLGMPFGDPETPLIAIQEYAPEVALDDFENVRADGRDGWAKGAAVVGVVDLGEIVRRVKALEAKNNG